MRDSELRALLDTLGINHAALMAIGYKHFGNPIPKEWYSAAEELLQSVKNLSVETQGEKNG